MSDFILYSYFRSSASYRVRIALNIKNIPFEYRAVHLLNNGGEQLAGEYRKLNPSAEVPTLIHNGKTIGQSMAIIEYLDHAKPSPRLFPEDPFLRSQVTQVCEIINSGVQPLGNLRVLHLLGKTFDANQEQKDEWVRHWIRYGLEAVENFLKNTAGDYSFGNQLTAADCFMIPHLANADRFKVDLAPYPIQSRLKANCAKLESFKKAAPSAQPDTPPDLQK